jgi:prolyl oligopeptidase
MRYTERYLSQVKIRPEIVKRLTELEHVEVVGIPVERNDTYFYTRRLPDENQASIYVRKGLHGSDERLVDATKLSADQNTSVHINDVSKDASLLVYGVREGGADEETVHLLDVPNRKELADVLPRARYQGVNLSPDAKGLYYAKYGPEGTVVYYHQIGSPVDSDQLVFGKEYKGEHFGQMELISAHVTENGRYLIITVSHGVPAKRVDIYAKDLGTPNAELREMVHGIDSRFTPVNYGDDLYVLTDYKADNYRVIKISMADPEQARWQTIVPESKDAISGISIAGGRLFVTGLHDVVTETRIFNLDGKQIGKL